MNNPRKITVNMSICKRANKFYLKKHWLQDNFLIFYLYFDFEPYAYFLNFFSGFNKISSKQTTRKKNNPDNNLQHMFYNVYIFALPMLHFQCSLHSLPSIPVIQQNFFRYGISTVLKQRAF